jgi:hypothetical protein
MPRKIILLHGAARSGKDTFYTIAQDDSLVPMTSFAFSDALKNITIDVLRLLYGRTLTRDQLDDYKNRNDCISADQRQYSLAGYRFSGFALCLAISVLATLWTRDPTTFLCMLLYYIMHVSHGPLIDVRHLLQQLGTDILRARLSDTLFVDVIVNKIRLQSEDCMCFVTDCRYDVEARGILDAFPDAEVYIIHITRPVAGATFTTNAQGHLSVTSQGHSSESGLKEDHKRAHHISIINDRNFDDYITIVRTVMKGIMED